MRELIYTFTLHINIVLELSRKNVFNFLSHCKIIKKNSFKSERGTDNYLGKLITKQSVNSYIHI